jgi:hypothetical protein
MMFFPQDPASREAAEKGFEKLVAEEGKFSWDGELSPPTTPPWALTARAGEPAHTAGVHRARNEQEIRRRRRV